MTTVLIIDKPGTVRELVIKSFSESDLFKKAGFKSPGGFKMHAKWDVVMKDKMFSVRLFGKTVGRGMQENKYEFPPPVDSLLLFGNCVLVNVVNDVVVGLSKDEWSAIYENLYGGFIDTLDMEGSSSVDESVDEDGRDVVLTKEGYEKNDFIVDDSHTGSEESSDESVDMTPIKKAAPKRKPSDKSKSSSRVSETSAIDEDAQNNNYMDCSMELDEEEYI